MSDDEFKVGDRVGAIAFCDENILELFGYGIYEGKGRLSDDAVGSACIIRALYADEENPHREDIIMNPKIKLDNGDIIWGCECWWHSEETVKQIEKESPKVRYIKIEDFRKDQNED